MAKIVGAAWVAERLERPGVTIIDPRRPMKYLAGHLPGAINIPVYKTFAADGQLLAPTALAEFIGGAGLDDSALAVIYDSPEGQNAAMLAWILEYLGRGEVHVMEDLYEHWKAAGREVRYKPVAAPARRLTPRPNPSLRVTIDEVREGRALKLIDFRSREEFSGERTMGEDSPGHIPGALNLVWRELADVPAKILKPAGELTHMLQQAGVAPTDKVIAYCRSGLRASLGWLALRNLGYDVRLFDGSFAQWSRAALPAEK
jgi:thiosulfate/3-mercaptopyruvate sulfurtransferase